jgi:hypothetical protein
MELRRLTLAIAACGVLVNSALGQVTWQTNSLRPGTARTNDVSYYAAEEVSPSDETATAEADKSYEDSWSGKGSCDAKGSCYLFGPDEPWQLSSGDNALGVRVGGWVAAGYHTNPEPLSLVYGDGLAFLDVPDGIRLHQSWVFAERAAARDSGWDWGFRTDLLYGTDAHTTQAYGQLSGWDVDWDNGVYGWALPQLYAEIARENLSIKAGHFFTPAGYEVVGATGNFFYSHSFTHYNSEPFTHSGVMATANLTDRLEAYGGWVAGWDTAFTSQDGGNMGLGGLAYQATDAIKVIYITTIGDLGLRGGDAYYHGFVVDLALTERLGWVIQSDLLSVGETDELDKGVTNYLFYTINDCWKVGMRAEWWYNGNVANNVPDNTEHTALTFGLNYRPHANLVLRPEVRWNRSQDDQYDVDLFGIDAVVTF